jgi:Ser/Thr protein kinase RdoA (MazF antagonist)
VHRPGYNSRRRIESELAWIDALSAQAELPTPIPLPAIDGSPITSVTAKGASPVFCVRFDYLEGDTPDEDDLTVHAEALGGIAARMHLQSQAWRRPAFFERLSWDFEHALGATPNWGDWRHAPALDDAGLRLLARLVESLQSRLHAYGKGPDRYGLIHADLRVANLIVRGNDIRVIDFDDSGTSWFLYDLATALSFMEERQDVPEIIERWLRGYEAVRNLSPADRAEIPTFLMFRRMIILAWIGSHSETDLARALGPAYTAGTCALAEQYLAGRYLPHLG